MFALQIDKLSREEVKNVRKVGVYMEMSRVSSKGQITIPIEYRRKLGIKDGDKVIFIEKDNNILLLNSNRLAFKEFQAGMAGEAEKAGIKDEYDVLDIVKQIREQMLGEQNANNA